MFVPRNYSIVSGVGESMFPLVAFDNALRNAGIGDYNLVKVSSILPAHCVYKEKIDIEKGSILFTAYASMVVQDGQCGSVATATAIPLSNTESGVIFETSSKNNDAENIVREMCCEAMINRDKYYKEIKSSFIQLQGKKDVFTCGVSAVVMW